MACDLAVNLENQTKPFLIKDSNYPSEAEQHSPEASVIWEIMKVLFQTFIYTYGGPAKVSDLRWQFSHSLLKFWGQILINIVVKQREVSFILLKELLKL